MSRLSLLLAGVSIACLAVTAARAEDKPTVIEEVVVTAQKVETNLQKTPLAITALSGSALEQGHIVAPKDLDNIVPGLVVNTTPSNPLSISIRGAGYEGIENTSAQPGVSYNQNGVYIASPISLNANFLDVDKLEVLRGPQGTVLGQNSDGGAINVTTVRPQLGAYTGYADISGGSYSYDRVRAVGNLPVGDTFAVRVAVQQEAHDGWAVATGVPGTGGKYDLSDEDSFNARIDALWKPIDPLSIELWVEHYQNDTNGDAYKNLLDPNPDPRKLTQDFPSKMKQRSDNAALTVGYDLGFANLKLIGSYQQGSLDGSEDLDKLDYATALPILGVHDIDVANNRDGHSYTAEVDLTSKSGTALDWIVGAFFLYQRYNEAVEEYQYNNNAANQAAYAAGDFNFYAPYGLPVNLSPSNPYYAETANFNGPIAFETRDTQKLESGSIYAQGTYHITDALRVTLGARGTVDNQIGVIQDYFGLTDRNNGASFAVLKTKFTKMTGRAEIEYDIAPLNTVYAMVSDGIKPGGANLNPGAVNIPLVFAPERVDALEIGSKNEFFGKTLRVNLSAFYNKIHDFQVDSEDPIPFQGGLTNVPESHVDGLEAEATELLPYNLRLDGNLTLQQSRVDSHQQLLDPAVAEQIDIANGGPFNGNDVNQRFAAFNASSGDIYGHQLPKVPPFTGNVALQHNWYFADGGKLTSSVHLIYRNPYYFRIYNSPTTDLVPVQRQADLNFTYTSANAHWHADFLVINLTNSDSVNSRYTDNFGTFITANYYVPPRQFIVRLGYSF
ncbi:TonB-dependent receptor [Phenylobacterium sp.]|uniref:TonB-dependent receptor n=1 Tax=Phenylobacterium sp. TaxID=1871053 RepID=UPI0012299E8C|nr:TonB-dependent receptor [Phenylobacterium sp.]THD66133.1 MAG: TonB-dependent receptor [Phenylobacterium sp.]